jgi:hypothetical protein
MAESMTVSWSWQALGQVGLVDGMLIFAVSPPSMMWCPQPRSARLSVRSCMIPLRVRELVGVSAGGCLHIRSPRCPAAARSLEIGSSSMFTASGAA